MASIRHAKDLLEKSYRAPFLDERARLAYTALYIAVRCRSGEKYKIAALAHDNAVRFSRMVLHFPGAPHADRSEAGRIIAAADADFHSREW